MCECASIRKLLQRAGVHTKGRGEEGGRRRAEKRGGKEREGTGMGLLATFAYPDYPSSGY